MRFVMIALVALVGCAGIRKAQGPSQPQETFASAEDERREMTATLEASGPSDEPWTRDAAAVFTKWKKQGKGASGVTLSSVRCFRAGCLTTASYDSAARASDLEKGVAANRGFQDWPGARYRSPVVKDGKKFVTDWILYRPEAVVPAEDAGGGGE